MHAKRHIPIKIGALPVFVAAVLAVAAASATAATNVTSSGITSAVQEPSQPVRCSDWGNVLSSAFGYASGTKDIAINGPTVWAAPLANGSRGQYVAYRADVWDIAAQRWYDGSWTSYVYATTTSPASLPQVTSSVPAWDPIGVRIHIVWWDPVSSRFSGTLDYTVNRYYNLDYSPVLISSSSC